MPNNAPLDFAARLAAFGCERVKLIDEDDAGRAPLRFLEDGTQARFTFAIKFIHDFGAINDEEGCVRLGCYHAGNQGFPCSRRAVEQHTFGRFNAQAIKDCRVFQGQLDHLANTLQFFAKATNILVADTPKAAGSCRATRLCSHDGSWMHDDRFGIGDRLRLWGNKRF